MAGKSTETACFSGDPQIKDNNGLDTYYSPFQLPLKIEYSIQLYISKMCVREADGCAKC